MSARSLSRVSPEKMVALLLGSTIAISTTNVLFSLTENQARGFDFHYSEVLLGITLFLGWRFKLLQTPQPLIMGICIFFLASTAFSNDLVLTAYSSLKFTLIFVGISSLRGMFKQENHHYLVWPIIFIISAHMVTAVYQANIGSVRPGGLAGNPNLLAGIGLVIGGPVVGTVLIGISGTRAAVLALLLALPLIGFKLGWHIAVMALLLLSISIMVFTYAHGSFGRVAQIIPIIQDIEAGQINRGSPEGFSDSERGEQFSKDIGWVGTGFDTKTGVGVNPHNIYLIILQEMGWIIGLVVLILFGLHIYSTKMSIVILPILIIGWFDHYWLTTAQGMYLFAMVLAGFKFWEDRLD